jgi:hypothetical protein
MSTDTAFALAIIAFVSSEGIRPRPLLADPRVFEKVSSGCCTVTCTLRSTAARLVDPDRRSPAANRPGWLVSYGQRAPTERVPPAVEVLGAGPGR